MTGAWTTARGALLALALTAPMVAAQSFSYVGVLQDASGPVADGDYDIRVRLFDAADGATEIAAANERTGVPVRNGNYALVLDFGSAVLVPEAWLQLEVRAPGDATYDTLLPRQRITGVPLALLAQEAATVDWAGIQGMPAGFADDVDGDVLATLACDDAALPRFDAAGGGWVCGAPGADGADGADGRSVLSGAGAPALALGTAGDFYIDTAIPSLYGPKAADWGDPTPLVGPPGPAGLDAGETPYPGSPFALLQLKLPGGAIVASGLAVHALEVSAEIVFDSGGGGGAGAGQREFGRLVVLVDPGKSLPQALNATTQTAAMSASVRLGLDTGGPPLVSLTGVQPESVALEPASGPGQRDLLRMELAFQAIELHAQDESVSWNLIENIQQEQTSFDCTPTLSQFVVDRPGSQSAVAAQLPSAYIAHSSIVQLEFDGISRSNPVFGASRLRFEQTSMAGEYAQDFAGLCALQELLRGSSLPQVKLERWNADLGTKQWDVNWRDATITYWKLASRADGVLEHTMGLNALIIEVVDGPDTYCWDAAMASTDCPPAR